MKPRWSKMPTAGPFLRIYPPSAKAHGIQGHSAIDCIAQADGTMAQCVISEETPTHEDFGKATLNLRSYYLLDPKTCDGEFAGKHVTIKISWRLAS